MRWYITQPGLVVGAAVCGVLLLGCGDGGGAATEGVEISRIPEPPSFDGFDTALVRACREAADSVRTRPGDARAWTHLGMVYEAHAMHDYAGPCFERSMALDAGDPKVWYRLAIARARDGDVEGTLEAFDRTLALAPDYGPCHRRRARFLVDLGRAEEARAGFEAALALYPSDRSAALGLVQVQLELGRPEEALRLLKDGDARLGDEGANRGTRAFARRLEGLALTRLGRADEVEAEHLPGARPGGTDPWQREVADYKVGGSAVLMRADRLLRAGRTAPAIAMLERQRESEPGEPRLQRRLGRAYGLAGRWGDAAESMRAAAELEPDDAGLWLAVAAARRENGDPEGCLTALERAIEVDAAFAAAYLARSEVLLELGRFAAALEACDLAAEQKVVLATLEVAAGKALLELDRRGEALVRFERAVSLDADLADAWAGCALLLGERDESGETRDPGAAAEALRRLETIDPQHQLLPSLRARSAPAQQGEK